MAGRPDQAGLPGTWRGAPPVYGSGQGPKGTVTGRARSSGSGFTPTVVNLLILVVVEVAAYAALRYFFRTAHGG